MSFVGLPIDGGQGMKREFRWAAAMGLLLSAVIAVQASHSQNQETARAQSHTTFYRDVLPILQQHCQVCHRKGGIAPMPLETYQEAGRFAPAIRVMTRMRAMAPWFAEKGIGKFSNDPSLSESEIALIAQWAGTGARAGSPADAPAPRKWAERWTIPEPDLTVTFPEGVKI